MYQLKKLSTKNYKILRLWRNENRQFFIFDSKVSQKQHESWWRDYQTNLTLSMFVVYDSDKPIGTISLKIEKGEGEIGNVMLGDKTYERKGVMSFALEEIMRQFKLRSYKLAVLKENDPAIKLYQKFGFVISDATDKTFVMTRYVTTF